MVTSKKKLIMNKKGPIVLIGNKNEDRKLFIDIFSELKLTNKMICFDSCNEAQHYLSSKRVRPFLMFSDIELFHKEQSSYKNICLKMNCPCLFFTTLFNQCFVIDSYSMPTQSYFVKPYKYEKFKEVIQCVIQYWRKNKLTAQNKTEIKITSEF